MNIHWRFFTSLIPYKKPLSSAYKTACGFFANPLVGVIRDLDYQKALAFDGEIGDDCGAAAEICRRHFIINRNQALFEEIWSSLDWLIC